MKRMLLLAMAGTCLGCVHTPPYNYTAISATDGENGVTVEGIVPDGGADRLQRSVHAKRLGSFGPTCR